MSSEFSNLSFDLPKNQSNVIKVIGVGGGGSNAVNHMYNKGIKGVDFVVCNTDAQALHNSPVPNKIQLGANLTEGLGAGANPEIGEQSAMESMEDIKSMLNTKSKMLFITVGMGGGTGTGAAPVIAKIAQEMDVLTVGIVTIPFSFEGKMRNEQAQLGIRKLRKHFPLMGLERINRIIRYHSIQAMFSCCPLTSQGVSVDFPSSFLLLLCSHCVSVVRVWFCGVSNGSLVSPERKGLKRSKK